MAPKKTSKKPAAKAVLKPAKKRAPLGASSPARTASGKKVDVKQMRAAEHDAIAGLKERMDEGMRASGVFPVVQEQLLPRSATDDSIGDFSWALTEDQRLLQSGGPRSDFRSTDPWRVMRITSEFVEGFDKLAGIEKGVSIFGSARTHPDDPQYLAAVETARILGAQGFSIITGAGPGIMEAANKGARLAGAPSYGCNIELPFEQGANPYVDTLVGFRYFAVRKTMFIKYSSAFIIFPGGFGTFDEMFEALTLIQTGKISPGDMDLMVVTDDPAEAARVVAEAYELQLKTARKRAREANGEG